MIKNKSHKLRFRESNRNIFNAIKTGKKKVETRAATERYRKIKVGDSLTFICGKSKINKIVSKVQIFKTIASLIKRFKPIQINPGTKTKQDLIKMYHSFPQYEEKLKKSGIIAFTLK